MKKHSSKFNERGDTIVEVIISVGVLSLALTTSFVLAGLGLRNATAANQRSEALSIAQGQVGALRGAQASDTSFARDYEKDGAHFCINPDATINTKVGMSDNLCDNYNGTVYNIGITYASSSQIFTVTATWSDPHVQGGSDQLNLYYKVAGNY